MKILVLLIIGISINFSEGHSQSFLSADETEYFIFDPSNYQPDNEERSQWIHQPLGNIKHTSYIRAERGDGQTVILAESNKSASGLVIPVDIDPKEFPLIKWEWKIEGVLEDGDLTRKDGDDYAARIYITFDYPVSDLGFRDRIKYRAIRTFTSFDVPTRALNYIWANKAEKGTIASNPYTDWVKMIAVQSGNDNAGLWKSEKRNIYEDYREAFGEEPPNITGVQIMTDSDNTESSAKAAYGKIIIKKESAEIQ